MNNRDSFILKGTEEEFKALRNQPIRRQYNHTGLMRTALVNKEDLSKPLQQKMKRTAMWNQYSSGGISAMNVKMGNPTFYHPLFQAVNMMLPRDRRERNEWCRHFYRTEPIISTAIDMHTEYPISDFNNQCADPAIKQFYDYMAFDKLDIINLLLNIGHEYWKIGDVFPFGQLNENTGMWEKFVILNPDYINIQASVFAEDAIIELIPDDQITTIVNSGPNSEYGDLYKQLPPEVIRSIKMNRNIRLDNRLVSHIAHKASDYEIWGTPLMMRCFKTLIYKDKLRGAQDALANRHIFPIRLAKIGTPGEPYPTQADLDSFRDNLMLAEGDPASFIVYHYGVQLDYVGSTGHILPLNTEFDFIQKELMNGLGIDEAMLNGSSPTYATAQVGADAMGMRYMSYRYRLESFIRNKIYRPIAEIQGFYKPKNGEIALKYMSASEKRRVLASGGMDLIIPTIRWSKYDLTSNQSAVQILNNLQGKKLVSVHTIHNIIGLDPEVEKKWLEQERNTVLDPDFKGDEEQNNSEPGPSMNFDDVPADVEEASNKNNMERFGDTFVSSDVQDMFNSKNISNSKKSVASFFEHRAETNINQLTLKKHSNDDMKDTQKKEKKTKNQIMNDKLSMVDNRTILRKQDFSSTQKNQSQNEPEKTQEKDGES